MYNSVNQAAIDVGVGAVFANGFNLCKDDGAGKKFKALGCILQVFSWLPVVAAIVGIVRIVFGSILVQRSLSNNYANPIFCSSVGACLIHRGSVEVLTLGLIAPINIIIDITSSIAGAILFRKN